MRKEGFMNKEDIWLVVVIVFIILWNIYMGAGGLS